MCSGHISNSSETTGIYVVKSAMAEHSMNAECHIELQNMVILLTKYLYMYKGKGHPITGHEGPTGGVEV
jgi:hypothetical protein